MIVPESPSAPESVPPTSKKRVPTVIVVAIVFAFLLIGGAVGMNRYLHWAKQPVTTNGSPIRVPVASGTSVEVLAKALEQQNLIRSARVFTMLGKNAAIRPGIYDISPSESPAKILARLEKGDVVTVRVTFPEGFTVRQIAKRLAKNGLCNEGRFYDLVTKQGDTLKASFPLPANLEGYLFPATYRFPLGESESLIAQRMVTGFENVFAERNADAIRRSGHPLSELVTVASMVEREAQVAGDRPLIAGVIYNRLLRGMRLQIDATVQYALAEHKSRLLYRDLTVDSPYNTYRVSGLPPGPICCPGADSLQAALSPAHHDFLFYVAKADGSHVFGKTLAEHNHNIAVQRRSR